VISPLHVSVEGGKRGGVSEKRRQFFVQARVYTDESQQGERAPLTTTPMGCPSQVLELTP